MIDLGLGEDSMISLNYPIVIYPCDEGGYVAEVPALKGCLAQGETLAETLDELETVKQLWLKTAEKQGRTLPDINWAMEKVKSLSYST
jgi:predicted RNase H-like HicB family nuclease